MTQQITITNLRIPTEDWRQIKAIAAEEGLSANEFINIHMRNVYRNMKTKKNQKKSASLLDLAKLADIKGTPLGASDDDKLIYAIND